MKWLQFSHPRSLIILSRKQRYTIFSRMSGIRTGLMFDPESMFHGIPMRNWKINDSHAQTTKELVIKLKPWKKPSVLKKLPETGNSTPKYQVIQDKGCRKQGSSNCKYHFRQSPPSCSHVNKLTRHDKADQMSVFLVLHCVKVDYTIILFCF